MSYWIVIFIVSALLLFWSGSKLVGALMRIARFLGWREFVVAFFVMAVAGSLPNLFIGINSAIHGIPQLSFGDIVGGNIVDLTLAVALTIMIGGTHLPVRLKMIRTSVVFTAIIAILPLILILDGILGRGDAWVLFFVFGLYVIWLFSRENRFRKVYNHSKEIRKGDSLSQRIKRFFNNLIKVIFYAGLLLIASEGIVRSAGVFSSMFDISLPLIGIFILGVGNALPETYFAIVSARKHKTGMILGDLIGSVIICSTLVLGVVAFIHPIQIDDFSPFAIARIFLIISAFLFLVFVKNDNKISRKEGLVLLAVYILFILVEVYLK